jgi:UDP-glucose 4-epimerase
MAYARLRKEVIGDSLEWNLQFGVPVDYKIFSRSDVLVTGGLGFIGSSLARGLVDLDANVALIDSLIPEYGGNLFNIHDIRARVTVNLADARDPQVMTSLIKDGISYLISPARPAT